VQYRVSLPLLAGGLVVALGVWAAGRESAPAAVAAEDDRPMSVSLVRLIATPEGFDGKRVRVFGYVRVEHEGTSIYLHREDYTHRLTKNGLWLGMSDSAPEGSREAAVNNRYALIEGRFSAKETGHMGLWSGSIKEVTRAEPWPPGDRTK
jgi:hypothetical protein